MYHHDGVGYRPYGSIEGLVEFLNEVLFHLHVHDYDGTNDHIEVGTGRIDFDGMLKGLGAIGYRGALCLELNPDRCPPRRHPTQCGLPAQARRRVEVGTQYRCCV